MNKLVLFNEVDFINICKSINDFEFKNGLWRKPLDYDIRFTILALKNSIEDGILQALDTEKR